VRALDVAAAMFSCLSSLCLFMAAAQLMESLPILLAFTSASALPQYLLLRKLHTYKAAKKDEAASELEDFLHSLSTKLSRDVAFEVAFQEAAQLHRGRLKPVLMKAAKELATGYTLEEALGKVGGKLGSKEARRLLMLIPRLSEYSSHRAGAMLRRMVEMMERNRALKERLLYSIKREELKVKVLSILYPAVLAALYQLARETSLLIGSLRLGELLSLNFSLASLSAAAPFYATLVVMGEGPLKRAFTSLSIYLALQALLTVLLP